MKDEIIEQVWKAKEQVASNASGDYHKLAEYIKNEAKKLKPDAPRIRLKKKKSA
jgi:hypothetical protein